VLFSVGVCVCVCVCVCDLLIWRPRRLAPYLAGVATRLRARQVTCIRVCSADGSTHTEITNYTARSNIEPAQIFWVNPSAFGAGFGGSCYAIARAAGAIQLAQTPRRGRSIGGKSTWLRSRKGERARYVYILIDIYIFFLYIIISVAPL